MLLLPLPGYALIEVRDKYAHVATVEGKYDTKTSGVLLDYSMFRRPGDPPVKDMRVVYEKMVNKLVYWDEYKSSPTIDRDGKKYAFVKIEDLQGYEDVKAD